MHPYLIRAVIGVTAVAILAVAAVPLVILVDLAGGGDGWGICPDGLGSCRVGPFTGVRLAVVLAAAVIALMAVLRFFVYAAGLLNRPDS